MTTFNPFMIQAIKWEDTPFHAPEQDQQVQDMKDWFAFDAEREQHQVDMREAQAALGPDAVTDDMLPF